MPLNYKFSDVAVGDITIEYDPRWEAEPLVMLVIKINMENQDFPCFTGLVFGTKYIVQQTVHRASLCEIHNR